MNLSNTYILNLEYTNYHCIISGISNSEAINLLQNIDFTEKRGTLQKIGTKSNFDAINFSEILI